MRRTLDVRIGFCARAARLLDPAEVHLQRNRDLHLAAVVRKRMSNDMLIVGSADDPAAARGRDAAAAIGRIAAAGQPFVSRVNDSGTLWLELSLWKQAGIVPAGHSWYEEIGRSMRGAYVLVERATVESKLLRPRAKL